MYGERLGRSSFDIFIPISKDVLKLQQDKLYRLLNQTYPYPQSPQVDYPIQLASKPFPLEVEDLSLSTPDSLYRIAVLTLLSR